MRVGIIAAAGNSGRTGLGDYTTKAALLLAGTPLLVHQLDFLQRSGFERAFVVCQPKHARLLGSLLSEDQRKMTAFMISEFTGGWGGKIEQVMPFISDDDEVAIVPCDNYQTAPKIKPLGDAPALFTFTSSDGMKMTNGPVFGSSLQSWREQPGRDFEGDLFTGYIVSRGSFLRRALNRISVSERGEKEITSLLADLWNAKCLKAIPYEGTYEDIADLHDLARIHAKIIGTNTNKTHLGAGVLLHTRDHVLLTERQDGLGWVPPGGLVDAKETFAHAAARELHEEIGYHTFFPEDLRLLGVYPTVGKGGEAACSIIFHHFVRSTPELHTDPLEVKDVRWFNREECKAINIPFDLDLPVNDFFNHKELDCR